VDAIANQDRSGAAGMPSGLFVDGRLVEIVADETDPAVIARQRALCGELLVVCLDHPTVAAVDCTACAPLDDDGPGGAP